MIECMQLYEQRTSSSKTNGSGPPIVLTWDQEWMCLCELTMNLFCRPMSREWVLLAHLHLILSLSPTLTYLGLVSCRRYKYRTTIRMSERNNKTDNFFVEQRSDIQESTFHQSELFICPRPNIGYKSSSSSCTNRPAHSHITPSAATWASAMVRLTHMVWLSALNPYQ